MDKDLQFKMILIGNAKVGKSCFLHYFVTRRFKSNTKTTLVSFFTRNPFYAKMNIFFILLSYLISYTFYFSLCLSFVLRLFYAYISSPASSR